MGAQMSEFARTIMEQKYAHDLNGKKETWENIAYRATKHPMRAIGYTMRDGLSQDICKAITDRKFMPAGRYLYASGRPFHQVCNCYGGETRVVTRDGTFEIKDLVGTSPILMTTKGYWAKSQVVEFGRQRLFKVSISFGKTSKYLYATAKHSWRLRKGIRKIKADTLSLRPGDILWSTYGYGISRTFVDPTGVCHGLVFGDGSVPKDDWSFNTANLLLCGKKAELAYLFQGYPTMPVLDDILISKLPRHYKEAPSLRWCRSYLLGWLVGYFAADGCVSKDGQVTLSSTNRSNLQLVKDVAYLLGIGVRSIRHGDRVSNLTGKPFRLYTVSFDTHTLVEGFFIREKHRQRFINNPPKHRYRWKVVSVEQTDRIEPVYCAVVPHFHEFVLENNILTGNCLCLGAHDSREGWSDLLYKASMALMTGAGLGVEYCLAPETRVLKADLTWVTIESIAPGDVLVGFDENLNLKKGQLQKSTVHSVKSLSQPSYLIETDQGSIVASAEHRWVARSAVKLRNNGRRRDPYQWVITTELTTGHEIAFTTKPWIQDTSWRGGYMAGILDGEGWLSGSRVGVSQNPGLVLDTIIKALNESGISYGMYPNSCQSSCTQIIPHGKWESMKLFGTYRPPRLEPKSENLWLGRKIGGKTFARILAITYLGNKKVVGLRTSTGTLIAEGFLCHNSEVRAEGSTIRRTGGKATGPLALMQMLNECGRGIMQGGSRRSALWAGLRWSHPDCLKFIHMKDWSEAIKELKKADFNFPAALDCTNISVGLDDEFFLAYHDSDHAQHVLAQTIYWETVKHMLSTGEPGFSVNIGKNAAEIYKNACTEICSATPDDICNLGSINIARIETIEEFERIVELGTVYLLAGSIYSDVPYREVDRVRTKNRRLGLGLMGVHEWLLKRGKPYAPDHELWQWLKVYQQSTKIARDWADELEISRPVKTRAIAPTGTVSIVAETTGGIEPIFCVAYKRRYLKHSSWYYQYVLDPTAMRLIKSGVHPDSIQDAYSLNVEQRVNFQAWMQEAVDHAISSTVNLPHWGSELNNAGTMRPFGDMLMRYLPRLRGITCYPDGARSGQPLEPVPYKEALEHTGAELSEEVVDVCDITKGGSCGD